MSFQNSPNNKLMNFCTDISFVKESSLLKEFLAERDEIFKYKWLESEKLGYDIGFERALFGWIRKHRNAWRAHWRNQKKQA